MRTEFLQDGAVRLTGSRCRFLCLRPRPGALITVVEGQDDGEFGDWLKDAVEQEYRRFGIPLRWFVDADSMEGAAHSVFVKWTEWLRKKPQAIEHFHVFVSSTRTQLTMAIAQHIAGAERYMTLHTVRERWAKCLAEAAPGWTDSTWSARFDEQAVDTRREIRAGRQVAIVSGSSEFTLERKAPGLFFLTEIVGQDTGAFGNLPFDELLTWLDRGKLIWFLDVRRCRSISSCVVEDWTQFLRAHGASFAQVYVLASPNAVPLMVAIAKLRSGMDSLRVLTSQQEFAEAFALRAGSTA